MRSLQRYLLYLAILLMPFQDCILGTSALGYLGSNISFAPISASALAGMFVWMYRGRFKVSHLGLKWLLYAGGLSLFYILLWGTTSHGFSVIHKTFAEGLIFFLWAYTIFGMDYTPTRGLKLSTYISFTIVILGVLACDLHFPGLAAIGSSSILHITTSYELDRWRGLSMEPSTFSATVVSLGLACAYFAKNKVARTLFIIATLVMLIASQSKGGLLVLALSAFAILFLRKPSPLRMTVYFVICVLLSLVTALLAFRHINGAEMFDTTATIATRSSLAVWAIVVVAHHPFGVGFSGFYEAITKYLPVAMTFVARVSPIPLNFVEIRPYVSATDVPIDAKCFLFEYMATFGIPFVIAYVTLSIKVIRALLIKRNTVLLMAFIFILIGFSTYVNGLTLYASFYVVGLAYREHKNSLSLSEIVTRTYERQSDDVPVDHMHT
jgi:hypothetical protein